MLFECLFVRCIVLIYVSFVKVGWLIKIGAAFRWLVVNLITKFIVSFFK